jgi:hypothetical protein
MENMDRQVDELLQLLGQEISEYRYREMSDEPEKDDRGTSATVADENKVD